MESDVDCGCPRVAIAEALEVEEGGVAVGARLGGMVWGICCLDGRRGVVVVG